jgi:anti-sigma B factor antagonist
MQVTESLQDKATILQLTGRLDASTCAAVETQMTATVAKHPSVVVDLAELDYISSAGLRVLLKAIKQAKAANQSLVLAGARANVKQVLDISGFANFCSIYPDRAQAVRSLS